MIYLKYEALMITGQLGTSKGIIAEMVKNELENRGRKVLILNDNSIEEEYSYNVDAHSVRALEIAVGKFRKGYFVIIAMTMPFEIYRLQLQKLLKTKVVHTYKDNSIVDYTHFFDYEVPNKDKCQHICITKDTVYTKIVSQIMSDMKIGKSAVFIGTFSPYLYSHKLIIEKQLERNKEVLIMVKDVEPKRTPKIVRQIKEMYHIYTNIVVMVVPNISTIEYLDESPGSIYKQNKKS